MSIRAQGLRTWLWQRFTAAYLAVFIIVSGLGWFIAGPWDYASWRAIWTDPVLIIAIVMFFAALFVHTWGGVRDIIVDYVPAGSPRFMVLTFLVLFLIVLAIWVVLIILRVVGI